MDGKKIKVLIIDDDEFSRETYIDVFKREGFEVIGAVDGLEGLDKATKIIPDIILTGIIMPKMDGFGLKDALAKNVATARIPVMMLSHMGREEDRKKAEKSGIKEFIVQGMITPKQVVEDIRAMFGPREYEYKINFKPTELDAPKLNSEFGFNHGFTCKNCQREMIMSLRISNKDRREFTVKFICPNCDKK